MVKWLNVQNKRNSKLFNLGYSIDNPDFLEGAYWGLSQSEQILNQRRSKMSPRQHKDAHITRQELKTEGFVLTDTELTNLIEELNDSI